MPKNWRNLSIWQKRLTTMLELVWPTSPNLPTSFGVVAGLQEEGLEKSQGRCVCRELIREPFHFERRVAHMSLGFGPRTRPSLCPERPWVALSRCEPRTHSAAGRRTIPPPRAGLAQTAESTIHQATCCKNPGCYFWVSGA